jgi:hypothetical protein
VCVPYLRILYRSTENQHYKRNISLDQHLSIANKLYRSPHTRKIQDCYHNICHLHSGCFHQHIRQCLKEMDICQITSYYIHIILQSSSYTHASCTHVKTHKLLQVCKQVVTNLFSSCRQVVFALLVPTRVKISHLVASLSTSRQQVVFALLVPSCQQV